MAIYNSNNDIRNFLTRGFIQTKVDLDAFRIIQDPTYLTFKVEFFFPETVRHPSDGTSIRSDNLISDDYLINVLSHEGLFLPPKYKSDFSTTGNIFDDFTSLAPFVKHQNIGDYSFSDSAEDYLFSIGSVDRIGYLRSFKQFLYKLQTEAPWYFQKIGGADSLYKVTPEQNTRQDTMLNFECLESLDMRMSMLADFYRQAVWDFERHREVLPYNMRTFRMRIHVLEMRHFNTTFGALALLAKDASGRTYRNVIDAEVMKNQTPGRNSKLSSNANNKGTKSVSQRALASAFDALSIQTYELGLCEFDFYSQAPGYLEDLNVTDTQMATFKFGIKYGTVKKTGKYSFYEYLTDYCIRYSKFPMKNVSPFTTNSVDLKNPNVIPFYDPNSRNQFLKKYDIDDVAARQLKANNTFSPFGDMSQDSFAEMFKRKDELDLKNQEPNPQTRVGGILGKVLGAAESAIGTAVNKIGSKVNKILVGNVFDRIPSPAEASQALLGFFNPDLRLAMGGERSQPIYDPGNVSFEALSVDHNIAPDSFDPLSVDTTVTGSGLDPLPIDHTLTQSPFDPLAIDHTLTQNPLIPLNVNHNVTQDPFDPLSVNNTVSGGGLIPLPPLGTLAQDPLVPLATDPNITAGGLDPLVVNEMIINDPIQRITLDKTIDGGGFDSLAVNSNIEQDPLRGIKLDKTVDDDPLEPAPRLEPISTKNANLKGVEITKKLSGKSVNFEKSTVSTQISPKNVYKKSKI